MFQFMSLFWLPKENLDRSRRGDNMYWGYVTTFDDIKHYCEANMESLTAMNNTHCEQCNSYKSCLLCTKEKRIDSILKMEATDSRLPNWFFSVITSKSSLLYSIPAFMYKKLYGLSPVNLPCPFQTKQFIDNISNYEKVYHLLSNETSKAVYLNVLMYRLTHNREYCYRAYSMEPHYNIMRFRGHNSNNVYVDCGAYIGDSFLEYCRYNDQPKTAYLFEPDEESIKKMQANIEPYCKETKIQIIDKGVYKKTGNLFLTQGKGVSSYLTESPSQNSIKVEVTSIDDAINEEVSIIKMDIEGSEKDAIIGAKKHIMETYPRLAISIYHYINDLWEIPLMINHLFPKYTNYELRHHSVFFDETVLYVYL